MKYLHQMLCMLFLGIGSLSAFAVSFRTAEEKDAGTIYDLICELATYERKDVSQLPLTKENLVKFGFGEQPYFYTELAEIDGNVVGYALYFYTFSGYLGLPVLYIEDLYVKPEYQKLGIGMLFFKRFAELAKEHECCRLEGHVFEWNDQAIAFYKNLGAEFRKDLIMVRGQKEVIDRLLSGEAKHPCFQSK